MGKFIIEYDRKGCIGAGVCAAVDPKHWVMNKDGKADLINGKEVSEGKWELEIDESELETAKMAAEGCPAVVIHIKNKDTGEQIV